MGIIDLGNLHLYKDLTLTEDCKDQNKPCMGTKQNPNKLLQNFGTYYDQIGNY